MRLPDDFEIRKFEEGDLGDLQHIRAQAFAPVFQSLREAVGPTIAPFAFASAEAEQEQLLSDLSASSSPAKIFVACVSGRPVGFAATTQDAEGQVGEIGLNAVMPEWAGRGIGTRLYMYALAHMKSCGIQVASVATGADPGHAPARRAYAKAGFDVTLQTQWLFRRL